MVCKGIRFHVLKCCSPCRIDVPPELKLPGPTQSLARVESTIESLDGSLSLCGAWQAQADVVYHVHPSSAGTKLKAAGRTAEGAAQYQLALDTCPGHASALYNMAVLHSEQHQVH